MPSRTCRNCKAKPVQPPYQRCRDCLPLTHRGVCEDCGADVIRVPGTSGRLPKRCEPCRREAKTRQTQESKRRALQDPEKLAKEQDRRRAQMRNWRANNPERARELARKGKARDYANPDKRAKIQRDARLGRLRRKYGLTRDEAEAFLILADSGCSICHRAVAGRDLHADHCHLSGTLRGWLCGTCNSGLGQFRDDPIILRSAADYVERFR